MVAEYDGAGALTRRYVHGPGVDEPVAVYNGPARGVANRRYTLPDERGSIVGLVHADGTPSKYNKYDEYGFPGGNEERFQYTGQIWIAELGMYHYKARIYSPTLGRFLQVDPIGYDDQINLYAYVGNDPLNRTDPTGMAQCEGDPRCGQVHQGAAEARSHAQRASADLRSLANAVKGGDALSGDQQSLMTAFERRFGAANESILNRVAGKLDSIGDKIGAEGSGVKINFGAAKGDVIASAWLGGNSITIRPLFFGNTGGISQASVIFHEAGHSANIKDKAMPSHAPSGIGRESLGKIRAYGVSATDWLGANDPERARKNNDSYHCFVIPACGGP